MDDLKTAKYIITEPEPNMPEFADMRTRILHLGGEMFEGAFSVACVWYYKGSDVVLTDAHSHDYDQTIAFIGSDPHNPHDLGGEIELWLDGGKHILTRSCVIFLPKGLEHCPQIVRKVDRPIFHFATGPSGT